MNHRSRLIGLLSDMLDIEIGEGDHDIFPLSSEPGYLHIDTDDLQRAADQLSAVAGRDRPWTWRYLRNILNEHMDVSGDLAEAVHVMQEIRLRFGDEVKAQKANVFIQGQIEDGTLIRGDSRTCAWCGRPFLPRTWNHKYCTPKCRKESYKDAS